MLQLKIIHNMSKRRGSTPPASQQYEFPEEGSSDPGSEGATAPPGAEPRVSEELAAGAAGGPSEGDDLVGDVPDLAAFFSMFPNCPAEEQIRLCQGYAAYRKSLQPRTTIWGRAANRFTKSAKGIIHDALAPDVSQPSGSRMTAPHYSSPGPGGPVKRTKRYWEK